MAHRLAARILTTEKDSEMNQTQMKDRLTHLIGLVRMRMYYANKIMNATEEYNTQVLNVPVF